jgi:2-oxoisovalerate dehydrogenase E1 component
VMGEWKTKVGDTVEIGQELGTIITAEPSFADQFQETARESVTGSVAAGANRGLSVSRREISQSGSPTPATAIEPALSPTVTRKLLHVIPANLQIDARWDAICKARDAAKRKNGKHAPSPSVMIAWAVVRAMEKHPPFRRLILEDERIVENENFDLGIAVAMEGDRLATAVIVDANKKSWPEFVKTYNEIVDATRGGRVDAMNASVVITSLGAFGVKAGAPIVVPPSVGTLFVGTAHRELVPNGKKNESAEVITLSLTFDHRVVNGAGAASFANEIKKQAEGFKIPTAERDAVSA